MDFNRPTEKITTGLTIFYDLKRQVSCTRVTWLRPSIASVHLHVENKKYIEYIIYVI